MACIALILSTVQSLLPSRLSLWTTGSPRKLCAFVIACRDCFSYSRSFNIASTQARHRNVFKTASGAVSFVVSCRQALNLAEDPFSEQIMNAVRLRTSPCTLSHLLLD